MYPNMPGVSRLVTLMALQRQPHIYGGTVRPETVAKRRTANRVARRSRRVNRVRQG